jgi:hypothetical protein
MVSSPGMDNTYLYPSNHLLYEIIIRFVLIPAVLLFLAYRILIHNREDNIGYENKRKRDDLL